MDSALVTRAAIKFWIRGEARQRFVEHDLSLFLGTSRRPFRHRKMVPADEIY
jgi:hypothetical protein